MKLLIINRQNSDLEKVLESCGADITFSSFRGALFDDLSAYDSYCVFADYKSLDSRLREKLENEAERGKKIFFEAIESWGGLYCAPAVSTVRSRLIAIDSCIAGLSVGDLLDDESNLSMRPWYNLPHGMRHILVYREQIIAHEHIKNADKEELMKNSACGLFLVGENVMMSSFVLRNFNRARFAPRESWQKVIKFLAQWLTGSLPSYMPDPVLTHKTDCDLSDDAVFEKHRREAISLGIKWLERFLIDDGLGGIREGLRHSINSEGIQECAESVRTDCTGEASGAFRFYGRLYNDEKAKKIADNLESFVFGPMLVKKGLFDGMLRWTESAWQVCYQDDVSRAVLPTLYSSFYFGKNDHLDDAFRALDFLVRTTAKDGCRVSRTDAPMLSEQKIKELADAEHGLPSAHYNAYYHAALLMAYYCSKREIYLETAKKGLERIMSLYPDTCREQSETEEMCRLILPLALLFGITGEQKHRDMLYRVADDLERLKHESGGYYEWDTGYRAACSRESTGECSLLTENGDPIADLLYSVNWLPIGFAMAYGVTGDERFFGSWKEIAKFFIKSQVISNNESINGSWCRAFDMERKEIYGCPHDVGWAANCSESGWTVCEILMGLMLFDIIRTKERKSELLNKSEVK